jgi:hypothetical protein
VDPAACGHGEAGSGRSSGSRRTAGRNHSAPIPGSPSQAESSASSPSATA